MAAKTASLVFFYFGEESYMNALAQETVPLWRALEGYDHRVLLSHDVNAGPFDLSKRAEKMADVRLAPTKENLVRQLNRLREDDYVVDVYIFAHGWRGCFQTSLGNYGKNELMYDVYLMSHVPDSLKIRMVWQCNCYGSTMNFAWSRLGAKVVAGTSHVNFYPTRFKGFIQRWQDGEDFASSIEGSDNARVRTPVQAYIVSDALARRKEWGGTIFQAGCVLGDNKASRRYFTRCWNQSPWTSGRTGREVMNQSSRMILSGDSRITQGSRLVW